MIEFQSLELKNFFSVGDHPLVIPLNDSSSTLVSGHNGAGKSVCVVDSLCWGLFNKPYRKVNKSDIVNNINGKGCLVTVNFKIDGSDFKVLRGIKPSIFEIYKNGNLIDQSANIKDYQKTLEDNILRLNYESFKQVVILSSSNFIPFMDLTAAQRRVVVEDILDIEIFSKMNALLKEREKESRAHIHSSDLEIVHLNHNIENLQKTIDTLKADNANDIIDRRRKITHLETKIKESADGIAKKSRAVKGARETINYKLSACRSSLNAASNNLSKGQSDLIRLNNQVDRTKSWLKCTQCEQEISSDRRNSILNSLNEEIEEIQSKVDEYQQIVDKETNIKKSLDDIETAISKDEEQVRKVNSDIHNMKRLIATFEDEISLMEEAEKTDTNIADLEKGVTDNRTSKEKEEKLFHKLQEDSKYMNFILSLLKDDGIKSKAIKQYLPVINDRANDYLKTLNFFVGFELDENFNELIRARHRETQTYSSLSQGEKQRIDLAMLFTWRDVARIKNSVNTNILILDETFDSSLDNEGIDNLLAILDRLTKEANIFVISHKGEFLEDRIENQMIFEKVRNFTTVRKAA